MEPKGGGGSKKGMIWSFSLDYGEQELQRDAVQL